LELLACTKYRLTGAVCMSLVDQAREHELVTNAWELSAAYHTDAAWHHFLFRLFNFLTNSFNVVIVLTVVLKQKGYEDVDEDPNKCVLP
jgi:hypothetical protein